MCTKSVIREVAVERGCEVPIFEAEADVGRRPQIKAIAIAIAKAKAKGEENNININNTKRGRGKGERW